MTERLRISMVAGLVLGSVLGLARPTLAAPEPQGTLPPTALEELAAFVGGAKEAAHVPGLTYLVVQGDQVVDARALGVKKLGSSDPVDLDTVFQIASTTKAFGAVLLAMLVEEGQLRWDDRVVDHLPRFAMHDPWVTREMRIADLICQRSGMPGYSIDYMPFLGFGRAEIIHAIRFVEPVTSFRSAFAYENNLWLLVASLVEQKTGLSWEDNLDRRILGPLGMVSTTASPEVVAAMPDVATPHFWDSGQLVPMPPDWPYGNAINVVGPAGAIRSNVVDLAQWVRCHINLGVVGQTRLLRAESMAYLHAPKTLMVDAINPSAGVDVVSYASGWLFQTSNGHPVVWHNGGATGMHSIVAFIPEAGVGLVMLTNEPDNQVPEQTLGKLVSLVFPQTAAPALGDPAAARSRRPPAQHLAAVLMGPPLPLERYAGSYRNPAYGTFEVRIRDGRLEMVFGPKRFVGVLRPYSGNTFTMQWPDWPGQVSTVTFTTPTGSPAEKMRVSLLEDVNSGDFVRSAGGARP
jgi:CubicO group peptidase (beta-lactamase class C family)